MGEGRTGRSRISPGLKLQVVVLCEERRQRQCEEKRSGEAGERDVEGVASATRDSDGTASHERSEARVRIFPIVSFRHEVTTPGGKRQGSLGGQTILIGRGQEATSS